MTGTRDSLAAKIREIAGKGKIKQRILATIISGLLSLPQRNNFKQMSKWFGVNETTVHNWYKRDMELCEFNRKLIDKWGSGTYVVIFDPSYLSKSGKHTPGLGYYWSGQAGAVKRGLEIGSFAVGDVVHHTAFHLHAALTPKSEDLKAKGETLMDHYVSLVKERKSDIAHLGGKLACDGYFGVRTFVKPVCDMGITLISCLKSNVCLHYTPEVVAGKKGRGRPKSKGDKIDWEKIDDQKLPLVHEDKEKRIRSAKVWVKCLMRLVKLVAVEYLKADGSLQCRKLYFSTDIDMEWSEIFSSYGLRFQIEFLFRDAKQHLGLTHCQSTDKTKFENHINLTLSTVSVAKAAHWITIPKEDRGAFSMAELKTYYHNLALVEQFSAVLGLDATCVKNNPGIKNLLFSNYYAAWAA